MGGPKVPASAWKASRATAQAHTVDGADAVVADAEGATITAAEAAAAAVVVVAEGAMITAAEAAAAARGQCFDVLATVEG